MPPGGIPAPAASFSGLSEMTDSVVRSRPETEAAFCSAVRATLLLVDASCMDLIRRPEDFDVIVASNLFGDILSEITAAITGSLGLAASANLDPTRNHPSMFESVHGSAPDIAGKGVANPVATILAGHMMLEFLNEKEAADAVYQAVVRYLKKSPNKTADLGGTATSREATDQILAFL